MKLLIAIPALNEEESIESIIQRSLKAKESIVRRSGITSVAVTVVSDGSTDKTVEIASRFADKIDLIVFKKNRGYGAAIKEAWKRSDAELLGFLDADGTCEPEFFGDLCKAVLEEGADMSLGCRIHPKSRMPVIRRIGNKIYAFLLSFFSKVKVRDTASGMRVVRRSSLFQLMPLPDGLHFTPAMSARAILSGDFKIAEIDMPYEERQGESKLRIWKDGLRFLRVIMESAFLYCPSRVFNLAAAAGLVYGALLMLMPSLFYLKNQRLEEWMIYRFLIGNLTGITCCFLFCAGHLGARVVDITLSRRGAFRPKNFFSARWFWAVPAALIMIGTVFVFSSLIELLTTGHTQEHWSRFVVMSFFCSSAVILSVTRGLDYLLDLVAARVAYLKGASAPLDAQVND